MSSGNQRRRLIKKHIEDSDAYRIPKKAVSHGQDRDFEKPGLSHRSNSSDSSLEDFITDKVEYISDHLPSSSEESAHSTDEENSRKKRRRESESSESEASAHETSSEPNEDTPEPSEESHEAEEEKVTALDPTRNLIGKEALAAKRAQGLLPQKSIEVPKEKPKKRHHHHHEKHHEKKKKHKPKEHKRQRVDKESKKYVQFGEFETPEERTKADLVTKILVRWWYGLPDWPVAKDYAMELADKNLRHVDAANWLLEPTVDEKGREKVREVSGYPGVFQNSKGLLFDLRDKHDSPTFSALFSKSTSELRRLLTKALEAQLAELTSQPDFDAKLAKELSRELKHHAGD